MCQECLISFKIRNKENQVKYFDEIVVCSWGIYEGKLRDAIIALKNGEKKLCKYFSRILVNFWLNELGNYSASYDDYIVVSVPSHKKRIKERGYCQTTLIAQQFAAECKVPFLKEFVVRKKYTAFMNKQLNIQERRLNIYGAFEALKMPEVKNILVIDDILTSGSTLCELARAIYKKNKNVNLIGLTIASGDRFN